MSTVTTGTIPFREWETWLRVTTPDAPRAGALPLIVLHGGPGMAHNYVRNLEALADETGRTVVHYDQLGCGNSTHLPDADAAFWTPALFVEEFENLAAHLGYPAYHLLGQSWGGMLGSEIAVTQPSGLVSLAICNSPASMELWMQGTAALRSKLPASVREALDRHEAANTLNDPEYLAATAVFNERHLCRLSPTPIDLVETEEQLEADPTVYHTMNGPNEFHIIGTAREWSIIDRLHTITVPTLVVAGELDEATPITWAPFVERIPRVRSHVFPGASHCTHLEQPLEFRAYIADFLAEVDAGVPVSQPA